MLIMQDYNTILGVIQMRLVKCSYETVQRRFSIGSSTVTLIMKRFRSCGMTYEQLKQGIVYYLDFLGTQGKLRHFSYDDHGKRVHLLQELYQFLR